MTPELFPHPVLPFAVAAVASLAAGATARRVLAVAAPLLALLTILALPLGHERTLEVLGRTWVFLRIDAAGRVFALAFAAFAAIAGIYAWTERERLPQTAALVLAGAGVGVALAGDLLSLFLAWEWLAIASWVLISAGATRRSSAAGLRYAYFHAGSGLCLLAGILMRARSAGGAALGAVPLDEASGWLILIGVCGNAAVPPLHAWLPDAYPSASPRGTVYLSAFTTKSAVLVLLRLFAGEEMLVVLGAAMALYGVVFAVLENDLRRLLAYHIVSQVGYMVCGVGLGTAMALNGAAAHAFSHIFYKGLLLMAVGAVIQATGRGRIGEAAGLARAMPGVLVLYAIGALSISGAPLLNGFISKSITVTAAAEASRPWVELALTAASTGTFLSVGLKLLVHTFFAAGTPTELAPVPRSMTVAMVLAAAVCIVTGLFPGPLYELLPTPSSYRPYTVGHVVEALEVLVGTAIGFRLLRSLLVPSDMCTVDVDRLYRRPIAALVGGAARLVYRLGDAADSAGNSLARLWARRLAPGALLGAGDALVAQQVALVIAAVAAAVLGLASVGD